MSASHASFSHVRARMLSPVGLFATPWTQPSRLLCPQHFPGKNTGVGCLLLHGIFPNQGWNPWLLRLLHWQVDSLPLCPLGNQFFTYGYIKGRFPASTTDIGRLSNSPKCVDAVFLISQYLLPDIPSVSSALFLIDLGKNFADASLDDQISHAVPRCRSLIDQHELIAAVIIDQSRGRIDGERSAPDNQHIRSADTRYRAGNCFIVQPLFIQDDIRLDTAPAFTVRHAFRMQYIFRIIKFMTFYCKWFAFI